MTSRINAHKGPLFTVLLAAALVLGCDSDPAPVIEAQNNEAEVETNRIAIPEVVRQNLGITFVKVERRRVAATLRVPGNFEHKATALTKYSAPVAGRIEMLVEQYTDVEKGQLLYRLDAPEWRKLQQELAEAEQAGAFAGRRIGAGQERIKSVQNEITLLQERIIQLDKLNATAGGRAAELAEARGKLAQAQSELAQAEADRAQAEMENVRLKTTSDGNKSNPRFDQALSMAATWTGLSEESLLERVTHEGESLPRWKTLKTIEVSAITNGHLEEVAVTTGGWVQEGEQILVTVDHDGLLFRARGLQGDLGVLHDGQSALIVPPQGKTLDIQDSIEASLQIGFDADPQQRIIDLLLFPKRTAHWARPGVSAHAEVVIDESVGEETAIPLSCIVTDGLERVVFMRDRNNPDQAIRMTADLGVNDGRWVVIRTGLRAGDEIVLHGAYELKLTGAGKAEKGGHFHSDGTFHEAH